MCGMHVVTSARHATIRSLTQPPRHRCGCRGFYLHVHTVHARIHARHFIACGPAMRGQAMHHSHRSPPPWHCTATTHSKANSSPKESYTYSLYTRAHSYTHSMCHHRASTTQHAAPGNDTSGTLPRNRTCCYSVTGGNVLRGARMPPLFPVPLRRSSSAMTPTAAPTAVCTSSPSAAAAAPVHTTPGVTFAPHMDMFRPITQDGHAKRTRSKNTPAPWRRPPPFSLVSHSRARSCSFGRCCFLSARPCGSLRVLGRRAWVRPSRMSSPPHWRYAHHRRSLP